MALSPTLRNMPGPVVTSAEAPPERVRRRRDLVVVVEIGDFLILNIGRFRDRVRESGFEAKVLEGH